MARHPNATWFPTLPETKLIVTKPIRKSKKPPNVPERLRSELVQAIDSLDRFIAMYGMNISWSEALDVYRANVYGGILNPAFVQLHMEHMGLTDAVDRLEKAWKAIHTHDPSKDFCAGVVKAAGTFYRTGSVNDDFGNARKLLENLEYFKAPRGSKDVKGTQGWIRLHVADRAALSERTIKNIIQQMRKGNKPLP